MPFRALANQYQISHMTAYRRCLNALKSLPHCADITRKYCTRFSEILLVDGKFVEVKGFKHKIPVIYGIETLFSNKISEDNFNKLGKRLLNKYINDELCVKILLDLERGTVKIIV